MRLIKQDVVDVTPNKFDLISVKKFVEFCGRTCYKSQDHTTEDSYEKFYKMLKNNNHLSVLEHGTVYCTLPTDKYYEIVDDHNFKWFDCPYKIENSSDGILYLSTNLRAILEHHLEELLDYMVETPDFTTSGDFYVRHFPRKTFKVICPISVSRELNRHETILSVSEQSTRYCNYSKDKFGGEISYVIPKWINLEPGVYREHGMDYLDENENPIFVHNEYTNEGNFLCSISAAESIYMDLLREGCKPEEVREILPLCTATEVIYTAWIEHYMNWDWWHILSLRSPRAGAKGVHPMCAEIADKIYEKIYGNIHDNF